MGRESEITLAEYKRQLLERSGMLRERASSDLREIGRSFAWIPRAKVTARKAMPLVALGIPLIGFFLARRAFKSSHVSESRPQPKRRGLLAALLMGIQTYHKVRPFVSAFVQSRQTSRPATRPSTARFDHR